ncbi:hypothetical protein OG275_38220 (plasmid) [Streptomyces niveus]|uniref:hypothetical protein n=1 Tax=Streptomyces niveus TaxID=193462 RepID=UPI002E36164A|nr:hypothetical protein [Streptomyces niveus]
MPVLGELFDTATGRLHDTAARCEGLTVSHRAVLTRGLDRLLSELRSGYGLSVEMDGTAHGDLMFHLDRARDCVRVAWRLLPDPEAMTAGPAHAGLTEAIQAVAAVRDTIESHRSIDRTPLTPYAYVFSDQPAIDYLMRRTADLAWQTGRVSYALGQGATHPGVVAALDDARSYLDQASVFGRARTPAAAPVTAAFPLALPVEPVQATTTAQVAGLADDCERLSRAAFEAMHDRVDHRLSGSDLQQLSHWTAMSRLLSGRVLLRIAEQHPDADTAVGIRDAAGHLRAAAQEWQKAAAGWRRIIDVADPRAHPTLPPPSYAIVRRGQVVQLPQVVPHPATVITHTSAVRVGRLLYGPDWQPERGGRQSPRSAGEILADTRGEGPMAAALYRLPATGRQLALAVPVSIQRATPGLVTDSAEHRPAGLDSQIRWYPIHEHQAAKVTAGYGAVQRAEETAAAALLSVAERAGTAVPRAALDAVAYRQLVGEPGTPDRARVRQHERAAAAAARSTGDYMVPAGPGADVSRHTAAVTPQGRSSHRRSGR